MGCQAGVGSLDHSKCLLQVFAGSGFERLTTFEAINEVSLRAVNTVSAISFHLVIRPNLLLPKPDFAYTAYPDRSRVPLEYRLVMSRAVVVFLKSVTFHRAHHTIAMPQREDRVILTRDTGISTRTLGVDRRDIAEEETRSVDVMD